MALMSFQMGDLATRVSALDGRALPTAAQFPQLPMSSVGHLPSLQAPPLPLLQDAGSATSASSRAPTPSAPSTTGPAAATQGSTAAPLFGVPIQHIRFPASPSPIPTLEAILGTVPVASAPMTSAPPRVHVPASPDDSHTGHVVPKYHKLVFPLFDGKEDPLGWLNKCEQFFNGHQTRHADRVWLASYHLTGVAQQWYLVLESDAGRPQWEEFRTLCQQRFGPPLSTNHLSDLARLPFTSTVDAYMEAF